MRLRPTLSTIKTNWNFIKITLELSVPIWRLAQSDDKLDGSYKVMVSLNIVLTTGQGLLIFSMFVVDYDLIIAPIEFFISTNKEKLREHCRIWFKRSKPDSNIREAECYINKSLQIDMKDIQHQQSEMNKIRNVI